MNTDLLKNLREELYKLEDLLIDVDLKDNDRVILSNILNECQRLVDTLTEGEL